MNLSSTFITFIIPTIGRESLIESIKTLINQDDNNWNAIIIFDGIKNNININDNRIKIIEIEKINSESLRNVAGLVRNVGIKNIENSEWIGFLDDDDYLTHDYISKLKKELELNNNMEICIFRMAYKNGYIVPTKFDKNIIRNKVGISFAIKKYITNDILFNNNPYEDYLFLKEAQHKKFKIIISSYITYFIRAEPDESIKSNIFPKILLNFY